MAREFSNEDASKLISEYKDLISRLTDTQSLLTKNKENISKDIDIFLKDNKKIKISTDDKNTYNNLVEDIYIYKYGGQIITNCLKLLTGNYKSINTALNNLDIGTNSLKWMMANQKDNDNASKAYELLKDNYDSFFKEGNDNLGKLDEIYKASSDDVWNDFIKDPVSYNKVIEEINPNALYDEDKSNLSKEKIEEVKQESIYLEGLKCKLRNYQELGVKYIMSSNNVLLGDEMGLGKTVEAIASLVSLKNTGASNFMVICPASVITNWTREIEDKSSLKAYELHGDSLEDNYVEWLKNGGVAVTTYESTASIVMDEEYKFAMLIVDEAHYIKNKQAQRSKNVKAICKHANKILFMTGTPLENKVEEMNSIISVLDAKLALKLSALSNFSASSKYKDLLSSVYFRRKREDVLTELPEKIETKEWCTLLDDEKKVYKDSLKKKDYMLIRRVSFNIDDMTKSSKAIRLLELVENAKADDRKVIVFSFFLDTINKVCELFKDSATEPITGALAPSKRQDIIDNFEKAPAGTVLPAQIISGGTGLNIQCASVVIICEPQFKPSIENQAISRAYRMGQTRSVLVYRLLEANTVDEKIVKVLENKQAIFDKYADESKAASECELDDKTFTEIVEEELKRTSLE